MHPEVRFGGGCFKCEHLSLAYIACDGTVGNGFCVPATDVSVVTRMTPDFFDNRSKILKDDLVAHVQAGDKMSVAASVFSMYAYREAA